MRELRVIAHERGLKYYMHLSKPQLFSLLQRKQGGGTGAPPTQQQPIASTTADIVHEDRTKTVSDGKGDRHEQHADAGTAKTSDGSCCSTITTLSSVKCASTKNCPRGTRSSLRLSKLKRKAADEEGDEAHQPRKKKAKSVINTLDPIMMCELGSHTVR